MSAFPKSPWLVRRPGQTPGPRLFCFHHAGGNANVFLPWARWLPLGTGVVGVQMPGRGLRRHEPLAEQAEPLIESLGAAMAEAIGDGRPFAFFGHSMGAWLAFETARWLSARGLPMPRRLVVAGRAATHLPLLMAPIDHLPDVALIAALRSLNGFDDTLATQTELLNVFLPIIRADLKLHRSTPYREAPPLSCPIRAVYSAADPLCCAEDAQAWALQTTAGFELRRYEGGHFFFNEAPDVFVPLLLQELWATGPTCDSVAALACG
jgi:medium-chain acyl-[acyl-carrier-protein] hydrolase